MTEQWIEHVAVEGDRWDTLAHLYYGDAFKFPGIVTANPHLPIAPYIEAGSLVAIPLLEPEAATAATSPEDLPPWKR